MKLYRVRTRNGGREPSFEVYAQNGWEARLKAVALCRLSGVQFIACHPVEGEQ